MNTSIQREFNNTIIKTKRLRCELLNSIYRLSNFRNICTRDGTMIQKWVGLNLYVKKIC